MGGLTGVVDEDVGISSHTCDCADHVAKQSQLNASLPKLKNVLVQYVELLCRCILFKELAGDLSLCGQYNSICC